MTGQAAHSPTRAPRPKCGRCAFCVNSCPVFIATGRQALGPRARLYALDLLASVGIQPDASVAQTVFNCTLCGRCQSICPSGLDILDRLAQGRRKLHEAGLAPEPLHRAVSGLELNYNPLGQPPEKRDDWQPDRLPVSEGAELGWWVGCLTAFQDARLAPAILKILTASGLPFNLLGSEEGCCGYLARLAGDETAFRQAAERNLAAFGRAGIRNLITGCAGCHLTFGRLYMDMGFDPPKMEHLVQWLERIIDQGRLEFREDAKPVRAIWHDPCDLGREQGIYKEPRRVLAALPGVETVEFAANRAEAECCGGGGGLKASDAELSLRLAERRVVQALETGAEVIVSACPSCKRNLTQGAARLRKKDKTRRIKVLDIAELVAARLAPATG